MSKLEQLEHAPYRIDWRVTRGLEIDQAWLVGCPACGDRKTGYSIGQKRDVEEIVARHSKEYVTPKGVEG